MGLLNSSSTILDLGCGAGLEAIGLEQRSGWDGKYIGVDVRKECVEFLKNIFHSDNRFEFHFADVINGMYNPKGKIKPLHYALPIASESINFVEAQSFFTHLGPTKSVSHYLREICRVLKKGGMTKCTFFRCPPHKQSEGYQASAYLEVDLVDWIEESGLIVNAIPPKEGEKAWKPILKK